MSSSSGDNQDPTRVGGVPVYVLDKKARPAVLKMIKGPGAPRAYTLEIDEIVVGRANDAHILIEGDAVSRRHALFKRAGEGHQCQDLGSSNGVYVNGEKIDSARPLADGDSVQVGACLFVYQAGSATR